MRTTTILLLLIPFLALFEGTSAAQTSIVLSSSEFSKEIEPMRTMMNKEMTVVRFKRDVFQDLASNKILESGSGTLYKGKGLNYKMINGGMTIVQTEKMSLVIDSANNVVQINSVDSSLKISNFLAELPANILDNYEFEKISYPAFFVLKATAVKTNDGIMEFYFHTKTKMLYKFVLTFPPANYFSEELEDESVETPSVVMVYEPMQALKTGDVSFDLSPYVKMNENGKFVLTEKMAGYELIDTRYQPTSLKN
ncbi:hypothetical protein [Fluviicola chungangensis]|uniref:DUF4292 domain-containing protein n=1 Tax=Fluviicola chungangensis TaxID=2597671 RepID=A0A556N3E7_9FLAO|nr:hypothetical protein [Fluviicola chungangensis]TSJ46563.1 hypothetical protein FO442_05230 [Fluviicola chungangensis]